MLITLVIIVIIMLSLIIRNKETTLFNNLYIVANRSDVYKELANIDKISK